MARRIYTSVENESKRVKTIYTPVTAPSTVAIKNLCPAINGSSGFTVGGGTNNKIESSTTHVKYSTNSLKITGDANNPEATAENSTTIALNSQHKYYVRVEVYQEVAGGGVDFYWPIAEPNVFSHSTIGPAGQWNLHSNVIERSSFTNGNYKFRLDLNNNRTTQAAWYDGWMIIDLTDTFGVGHEPDKEWCDTNITFFAGSSTIKRPEDIYIAKPVRRGYIGVNGIAKLFFALGLLDTKLSLSVARGLMGATSSSKYVLFGGGNTTGVFVGSISGATTEGRSNVVDIFDTNLVRTTNTLNVKTALMAHASLGDNYMLYAGGCTAYPETGASTSPGEAESYGPTSVTTFNSSTLAKSTKSLSTGTFFPAGASNASYIIVAGGEYVTREYTTHKYESTWHDLTTTYSFNSSGSRSTVSSVGGGRLMSASTDAYAFFYDADNTISTVYGINTSGTRKSATAPTGDYQSKGSNACIGNATHMYIGGGYSASNTTTTSMQVYDSNLTVKTIGSLANALNNEGVNIGGWACFINTATGTIEAYDPVTFVKTYIDNFPTSRYLFSSCNRGEKGFIGGGYNGQSSSSKRVVYTDVYVYSI